MDPNKTSNITKQTIKPTKQQSKYKNITKIANITSILKTKTTKPPN
jgi:hypothetical protein